jgi:hypothetical protein
MNYLFPGQQQMVYVSELRKSVPYFETRDEIPDTQRGHAAINQANEPGAGEVGTTLFSRPLANATGYPATGPIGTGLLVLLCLIVLLAIVTVIAICVICYLSAMQAHDEVVDISPTTCSDGTSCYSSKFLAGTCWYRDDCCTGEVTPLDPTCTNGGGLPNIINDILLIAGIGAGVYILFKVVLPSLKKEEKK